MNPIYIPISPQQPQLQKYEKTVKKHKKMLLKHFNNFLLDVVN